MVRSIFLKNSATRVAMLSNKEVLQVAMISNKGVATAGRKRGENSFIFKYIYKYTYFCTVVYTHIQAGLIVSSIKM